MKNHCYKSSNSLSLEVTRPNSTDAAHASAGRSLHVLFRAYPFQAYANVLVVLLGAMVLWMAPIGSAAEPGASEGASRGVSVLPSSVDLRMRMEKYGLGPRLQGARNTCSVFTMAGALEYAIAVKQGGCPRLSVEYLNWASNQAANDTDDGSYFSDAWKGYEAHGICSAQAWSYQENFDPASKPSAENEAEAQKRKNLGLRLHWIKEWDVNTGLTSEHCAAIKRTLSQGWPVCGGFRWPKKEQWVDEVLQLCPPEAVRDGHSVLLVGYRDDASQPGGGVFLFRNSAKLGRDGYMSYAYAQAYMNDAVWVDCETPAKNPVTK